MSIEHFRRCVAQRTILHAWRNFQRAAARWPSDGPTKPTAGRIGFRHRMTAPACAPSPTQELPPRWPNNGEAYFESDFFGLPPFLPFSRTAAAFLTDFTLPPSRPNCCAALFFTAKPPRG